MNATATTEKTNRATHTAPAGFAVPGADERQKKRRRERQQQEDFLQWLAQYFQVPAESFEALFVPLLKAFVLAGPPPANHDQPLIGRLPFGPDGGSPIEIFLEKITTAAPLTMEAALQMAMLAKSNPHMKDGVELQGSEQDRQILAAAAAFIGLKVLNGPKPAKEFSAPLAAAWQAMNQFVAPTAETGPAQTHDDELENEDFDFGGVAGAGTEAAIDESLPENKKWADLPPETKQEIIGHLKKRFPRPDQTPDGGWDTGMEKQWDTAQAADRAKFIDGMKKWQPAEKLEKWQDLPEKRRAALESFYSEIPDMKDLTAEQLADRWDNYLTPEEQRQHSFIATMKQAQANPAADGSADVETEAAAVEPETTAPPVAETPAPAENTTTVEPTPVVPEKPLAPEPVAEVAPALEPKPVAETPAAPIAADPVTPTPAAAEPATAESAPAEEVQPDSVPETIETISETLPATKPATEKPAVASTSEKFAEAAGFNVLQTAPPAEVLNRLSAASVSHEFYMAARKSVVEQGKVTVDSISNLGISQRKAQAVIQAMIDEGFVSEDPVTHRRAVLADRDGVVKPAPQLGP